MFFLLRSGLCIGIVYAMLPGSGPTPSLRDMASEAGRAATVKAERYCVASEQCLRTGARVAASLLSARLGTVAGGPADPNGGSSSDLLVSDLVPHAAKTRVAVGRTDVRAARPSGPV